MTEWQSRRKLKSISNEGIWSWFQSASTEVFWFKRLGFDRHGAVWRDLALDDDKGRLVFVLNQRSLFTSQILRLSFDRNGTERTNFVFNCDQRWLNVDSERYTIGNTGLLFTLALGLLLDFDFI